MKDLIRVTKIDKSLELSCGRELVICINILYLSVSTSNDGCGKGLSVMTPLRNSISNNNTSFDVVCDWLSFTFPCRLYSNLDGDDNSVKSFNSLLNVLKLNTSGAESVNGKCNYGYGLKWIQNTYLNKEVVTSFYYGILPNGKDFLTKNANGEYTSFFEMSGGACREFERRNEHQEDCWKELFSVMDSVRAKSSRFDFAIDIYDSPINLVQYLRDKKLEGMLSTTFKKFSENTTYDGDYKDGDTFYLGSRESDMFCRVYDKMAEMRQKNMDNLVEHSSWYRIEFKCAHSKAEQMRCLFRDNLTDLWSLALSFLNRYIHPLDENGQTDSVWIDILNSPNDECKTSLKNLYGGDVTVEKLMDWGKKSLSIVIATWMVSLGYADFLNFVNELVTDGIKKMDKKRLKQCHRFRERTNRPVISDDEIKLIYDTLLGYGKEIGYAESYYSYKRND